MRLTSLRYDPGSCAGTCIVVLPGAYQTPEDAIRAGFVDAARAGPCAVDLVLVDLELVHLTDRSILELLHRDVVLKARSAGCRRLWIAGISLGGFMALLYATQYPQALDGLLLLAPYLGNRAVLGEIARSGRLPERSEPLPPEVAEEHRLWRFIDEPPPGAPPLRLGFGSSDRFAAAHRLLAGRLPASNVQEVPGGHDWPAWLQLWKNFLASLPPDPPLP